MVGVIDGKKSFSFYKFLFIYLFIYLFTVGDKKHYRISEKRKIKIIYTSLKEKKQVMICYTAI